MKNVLLLSVALLTQVSNISKALANPFTPIYQKDTFNDSVAEYNVDGLVFEIDANKNEKSTALSQFESRCLNYIPQDQAQLFLNLQQSLPGLNPQDFQFQTRVIKTQGIVINGVQFADYTCRMHVQQNINSSYKIVPEYSPLYTGKESEEQCKGQVIAAKANQIRLGLLAAHYYVQYKQKIVRYQPEYGQVTFIKLKANPHYTEPTPQPEEPPVLPEPPIKKF